MVPEARHSLLPRAAPIVFALACAAGCAPEAPNASKPAPVASSASNAAPREVRTTRVAREAWERTIGVTGELAAFEESALSVKVPGRLVNLVVDLGTRVAKGALVAELDARDYELRVKQAEAAVAATRTALGLAPEGEDDSVDLAATTGVQLAMTQLAAARRDHERAQDLLKSKVGTQAQLDDAETALRLAETRLSAAREDVQNKKAALAARRADLALAKQQLADTRITAPFDGEVAARLAGTGDYLAAGAPVARLVRTDPLRVRLRVPEREAGLVRVGQKVRFTAEGDALGAWKPNAGITRIAPAFGAQSRALLVEVEVANPAPKEPAPNADGPTSTMGTGLPEPAVLRPGAFVRAEIVVDAAADALTVPLAAVVSFAGIDKLLVVKDGKVLERRVKLGRRDDARVEVLEGAAEGDEAVLAPGNLGDGAAVRVTK